MYLIDMTSTDNAVKALKDSREVQGESTLDPPPMAFSGYFILTEQVSETRVRHSPGGPSDRIDH